jgi:hypothetical protein
MKDFETRAAEITTNLRKRGLANGGSLGYHSGLNDVAADFIDELVAYINESKEISVTLPNGDVMRAVAFQDDVNPAIDIYLGAENDKILCFSEYNLDKPKDQRVCTGVYVESQEDSVYYDSYNK